MVRLENRVT